MSKKTGGDRYSHKNTAEVIPIHFYWFHTGGFSECGTLVKLDQEFVTASGFDNRRLNLKQPCRNNYFHNFFHRTCLLPEELDFINQLSTWKPVPTILRGGQKVQLHPLGSNQPCQPKEANLILKEREDLHQEKQTIKRLHLCSSREFLISMFLTMLVIFHWVLNTFS